MELQYKIIKYPTEHEAICVQFPHISWISKTKEEALEGAQEMMFRYLLDMGFQFGIVKAVW